MVKRAIAIVAGVTIGAVICLAFGLAIYDRPVETTADACLHEPLVDCVRYEAPARPLEAAPVATAVPCKSWLGAGGAGSVALLSQCLHETRQGPKRTEEMRRKLAIATSS